MPNSKQLKWRDMLDRVYEHQLRDLVFNREVFRQANDVWKNCTNKRVAGHLAQWMVQNYLTFAAVAIRRITDNPKWHPNRTLSLVLLLTDMAENHTILSRQWYVRKYRNPNIPRRLADRDFDRIVGRRGHDCVPKNLIIADMARLERKASRIKRLVDKTIAHTEKDRRTAGRQTWKMLDDAIDEIIEVYRRYHLLLNASSTDPRDIISRIDVTQHLKLIWP